MTFATHSEINQSMRPHLFFPSPSAFFAVHRPGERAGSDRHALSNTLSLLFPVRAFTVIAPLFGGRDIHRPILLEDEEAEVRAAAVCTIGRAAHVMSDGSNSV